MPATAAKRPARRSRQRTTSMLSFTRQTHKGRCIANSIHSTTSLFKDVNSSRLIDSEPNINPLDLSNRSEIPFNKTIEEVYTGVHDGPVLGVGLNGNVRLITNKENGNKFAVKRLNLMDVDTDVGKMQLIEEIDIMCMLDHPNIVCLEEIYESENIIYLVQELCTGGELFDQLDEQPDYRYSEEDAAKLVKQILTAVVYLHSQGIVHRDLKLENFLFQTKDADAPLKMIDFGLSKHFKYAEVMKDRVGTPYTVAPEVIKGNYDERCDVWGIGVITFILLCGDSPFGGCDAEGEGVSLPQIRANILSGSFSFTPKHIWDNISESAKDFISRMLNTNPDARPAVREVRNMLWLLTFDKKQAEPCLPCFKHPLVMPIYKALNSFKKESAL
mmetsp:Transcript_4264/g.6252  ORF Transcript_4264/g.6252 Transcript_4264/m.6252 type:complete len:387 (+) Transcript_4264:68-1228(+)